MSEPKVLKFLLVEDDDDHAKIIERSLKRGSVASTLDRVRDGVEALMYLRREGEYSHVSRPDVVILDLKLPKMDGHEVLLEIKEDECLRTIPAVILTTSDTGSDRMMAYRHHANSYLVKPLEADAFRRLVEELSVYWGAWNRTVSSERGDARTCAHEP